MNAPTDQLDVRKPSSKGMSMIAAYRAARLSQRSELRGSLHQSHVNRRISREERLAREHAPAPVEPSTTAPTVESSIATIRLAADPASIFANLVSLEYSERQATQVPLTSGDGSEASMGSPQETIPSESVDSAKVNENKQNSHNAGADQAPAESDPPLAEIGFGPGMLIRLSQLGLHTTADLAKADAAQLRAALGDISRLVDVETWITNARQTCKTST